MKIGEFIIISTAFLAASISSTVYADSVNCSAGLFFKSNKVICDSPELLDLDRQVAAKYLELNSNSALRNQKRAWKDERNDCKGDYECIKSLYQQRILDLDNELANQERLRKEQEALEQARLLEMQESENSTEVIEQGDIGDAVVSVENSELVAEEAAAIFNDQDKKSNSSLLSAILNLLILTAPITVPVLILYFKTRCPRCKRWFAKREVGRDELDRYVSSVPYTISNSRNHTSTGYRVVTVFVTEHYYCCKYCQYRWSAVKNHRR